MEPFEKLEITLESMINEKKKEVDRARNGEHELIGLQNASFIIRAIKNNALATSYEVIEKRYKSKPFKPTWHSYGT